MNESIVQPAWKEFLYKEHQFVQSVQQVMSKARATQNEKNVLNVDNPQKLT